MSLLLFSTAFERHVARFVADRGRFDGWFSELLLLCSRRSGIHGFQCGIEVKVRVGRVHEREFFRVVAIELEVVLKG